MIIRYGYEITITCAEPTPVVCLLTVHDDRAGDIRSPETVTTTVEGRERYPVRIRYLRELRDNVEAIERILVPAADGAQIPLSHGLQQAYADFQASLASNSARSV